jgi:hypothetical protein
MAVPTMGSNSVIRSSARRRRHRPGPSGRGSWTRSRSSTETSVDLADPPRPGPHRRAVRAPRGRTGSKGRHHVPECRNHVDRASPADGPPAPDQPRAVPRRRRPDAHGLPPADVRQPRNGGLLRPQVADLCVLRLLRRSDAGGTCSGAATSATSRTTRSRSCCERRWTARGFTSPTGTLSCRPWTVAADGPRGHRELSPPPVVGDTSACLDMLARRPAVADLRRPRPAGARRDARRLQADRSLRLTSRLPGGWAPAPGRSGAPW